MKKSVEMFHWLPRIICIIAILFISLFALDAFSPGLTLWQQLKDFFIHLIPTCILLASLIVAWKWERIGGIIFLIIGLAMTPFIFELNYRRTQSVGTSLEIILMITFPFILVGILFILSYFLKKKNSYNS